MVLVMNKEGDLLVYKNKGRLTAKAKEAESRKVNGSLRKELNLLKKKLDTKLGQIFYLPYPLPPMKWYALLTRFLRFCTWI